MTPTPRRRRRVLVTVAVATLVLAPALAGAAAFTAQLINGADTFSAGNVVLQVTAGAGACVSTGPVISSDTATCSADPYPGAALTTTPSSSTATVADVGSITPPHGSLSVAACAPQYLVNTATSANVGFPFAGVAYGQSMSPLATTAVALNGTSAWIESNQGDTPGTTYAVAAWFKTSAAQGTIIGFSSNQDDVGSTSADRILWIDATGNLVWGVYDNRGRNQEITSPSTYDDGQWHYVVASVGASRDVLYVDGAEVASRNTRSGTSYSGYWTLGWGSAAPAGWSDAPTNPYFDGDLADVTVFANEVTSAQQATLYAEPTDAAYNTQATADGASQLWPLDDSGLSGYAGTPPGFTAATPTLADATGNGDTGTLLGTGTLATAGPLGGLSLTLPGASGSLVSTPTAFNDPHPLSQSIWFKTTSSDSLMGFTTQSGDSPTPSMFDRMFWIDPTGHLVYAVYSPDVAGSYTEVKSPSAYNDGQWHLAVATVGPAGTLLYVDGALVAQNTTAQHPQNFTGYWHLGYAYTSTWSDAPTSDYLNGSIAHAAVYPSQLTATQVASLYAAGSTAAEESAVLGLSPTAYWPLQDTAAAAPCALVEATAQLGSTCLYPATGCATPSSGSPLSGLTAAFTPPTVGSPQTLTLRLATTTTLTAFQSGLQLLVPLDVGVAASTFAATDDFATATVQL